MSSPYPPPLPKPGDPPRPPMLYGPCTHPAIEKRSDGRWYCTECGQLRG